MRHFTSNAIDSFVLLNDPSRLGESLQREVSERLLVAIDCRYGPYIVESVAGFVFLGNRDFARNLAAILAPAEFRAVVELRKWIKSIAEQCKYRSPSTWFRHGDFIYCNLNTGKCFVCVDAHHWD